MLTIDIASQIVEQTMIRLQRNINIMNDHGIIIASGDESRLGESHHGALEVMERGIPVAISRENADKWEGSRPGLNLPIEYQGRLIGVIGISGNPEEIYEFGEIVKMITEMMIHHAYMAEQLEWRQRLRELVFDDLLARPFKEETTLQKLSLLNMDVTAPYVTATLQLKNKSVSIKELLRKIEQIFPPKSCIFGHTGVHGSVFILSFGLGSDEVRSLLNKLQSNLETEGKSVFRAGIGTAKLCLQEVACSYEESRSSLVFGKEAVTEYCEIEVSALLSYIPAYSSNQFIDRVLGKLPEKYVQTLEQFILHGLNIGGCSRSMFIHRNSLIYRLKKIKHITGLDPQQWSGAYLFQTAILMRKVNDRLGHVPPPSGD